MTCSISIGIQCQTTFCYGNMWLCKSINSMILLLSGHFSLSVFLAILLAVCHGKTNFFLLLWFWAMAWQIKLVSAIGNSISVHFYLFTHYTTSINLFFLSFSCSHHIDCCLFPQKFPFLLPAKSRLVDIVSFLAIVSGLESISDWIHILLQLSALMLFEHNYRTNTQSPCTLHDDRWNCTPLIHMGYAGLAQALSYLL